jgi:hypothetical protein
MGRTNEAHDAARALAAGFPGYAYLSTRTFSIQLLALTRAGEFEQARALAATRSADMPISYRDELLCDMLQASHDGKADEDLARIGLVLRRNDAVRAWIRGLAPGLAETLGLFPDAIDKRVAAPVSEGAPSSDVSSTESPASTDEPDDQAGHADDQAKAL